MTVTRQSLQENFHLLNDSELLVLFQSGDLTELAQDVATAELRQRGIDLPKPKIETPKTEAPAESQATPIEGDLVPIARFFTATEAYILQSRLEVEGVPAIVADANMVQTNPLLSIAIGGVRVLVPEADLARAEEILRGIARGDYALGDQADPE
jgi:hypothetical protein